MITHVRQNWANSEPETAFSLEEFSRRVMPAVPMIVPSISMSGILFVTFQTVRPSGWPTNSIRFTIRLPVSTCSSSRRN